MPLRPLGQNLWNTLMSVERQAPSARRPRLSGVAGPTSEGAFDLVSDLRDPLERDTVAGAVGIGWGSENRSKEAPSDAPAGYASTPAFVRLDLRDPSEGPDRGRCRQAS